MPTLPSEANRQIHENRKIAEGFGVDPERYDRTRTRYPEAFVRRIIETSPGKDVLDVGCGTGILARQFRDAGATVLGVEPDARMATFARRTGIDVEESTIEDWDPRERRFDAVVAGMTWHWVDPVAGTKQAARVLRPGGRIAVAWHAAEMPTPVASAMAKVFAEVVPSSPVKLGAKQGVAVYQPGLNKAIEHYLASGEFADPDQWRFDWEMVYTRAEWLDQIPTLGVMTQLKATQLERILDVIGAAIDGIGGTFTMKYSTVAATAVRVA